MKALRLLFAAEDAYDLPRRRPVISIVMNRIAENWMSPAWYC